MLKTVTTSVSAFALFAVPSAAIACDLDGMPGMHRFNPFGNMAGFRGLAQPAPPPPPTQAEAKNTSRGAKADGGKVRKKPTEPVPVRKWDRDDNNRPILSEDKATFT